MSHLDVNPEPDQGEAPDSAPLSGPPDEDAAEDHVAVLLTVVSERLESTQFPLQLDGVGDARALLEAARSQLADYIVPRYDSLDAPLLAVVGGSTGAGKSSLVNALVRHPVTRAGAIRPTTRQPILVHHPHDTDWFSTRRVLPRLGRITGTLRTESVDTAAERNTPGGDEATSLVLVADTGIPAGIALLDAPDIDSISAHNRRLAEQLLAAADLWVFVTTANRYADEVPWALLRQAAARHVTVAVVLDRVPPRREVAGEVSADLRDMLEREGLDDSRLFVVPESPLDERGILPVEAVDELQAFLAALAGDVTDRATVARRTLSGAVERLAGTVEQLGTEADRQHKEYERLTAVIETRFDEAHATIMEALGDGTLLRGEVLARWHDVIGTGDITKRIESAVGRLRDRMAAAIRGNAGPALKAEAAIESDLARVMVAAIATAGDRVEGDWSASPAGRALLESRTVSPAHLPADFDGRVARQIRDWQGDVLDLVRSEGQGRRTSARILSLGVNAVAVALMIVVFASTAFIPTGAEVGVGAGTAVIGQKLLEAIFGDEAVRRLAATARDQLEARLTGLLDGRREVFLDVLLALDLPPEASGYGLDGSALRNAAASMAELPLPTVLDEEPVPPPADRFARFRGPDPAALGDAWDPAGRSAWDPSESLSSAHEDEARGPDDVDHGEPDRPAEPEPQGPETQEPESQEPESQEPELQGPEPQEPGPRDETVGREGDA